MKVKVKMKKIFKQKKNKYKLINLNFIKQVIFNLIYYYF